MNEYIAKNWKTPKGLTIRAWLNNRRAIHKEMMLCPSTGGLTKLGDVKNFRAQNSICADYNHERTFVCSERQIGLDKIKSCLWMLS